jgi:predicted nucleotidyltransferase component of viral defense system
VSCENGHFLQIDTIQSIVSNKLCACVSRTEPKDFLDLYMILKHFSDVQIEMVYSEARVKDAIFDDPPTAAFQLEQGLTFLQENRALFPHVRIKLDEQEFFEWYRKLIQWMYARVHIGL